MEQGFNVWRDSVGLKKEEKKVSIGMEVHFT